MNFLAFNVVQFGHVDYKWHTQLFCLLKFPNFKELTDSSLQSEDMQLTELSQLYPAPAGGLSCFSFKNTFYLIPLFPEDVRQDWMLRQGDLWKLVPDVMWWNKDREEYFWLKSFGILHQEEWLRVIVFLHKPTRDEHCTPGNVYWS